MLLIYRQHVRLMQTNVHLNFKWMTVLAIKYVQVFVLLFIMLNKEPNMTISREFITIQIHDRLFVVPVTETIVYDKNVS